MKRRRLPVMVLGNRMITTSNGEIVIADLERLTRLAHHGNLTA